MATEAEPEIETTTAQFVEEDTIIDMGVMAREQREEFPSPSEEEDLDSDDSDEPDPCLFNNNATVAMMHSRSLGALGS